MADEIVATLVGGKVGYEGQHWGRVVILLDDLREYQDMIDRAKQTLSDEVADDLGVLPAMRDADWLARFRWVVIPLTQSQLEQQVAHMTGGFEEA